MSLTSCPDDPSSPISRFLSAELPAVAALAAAFRSGLSRSRDTVRPQGTGPFSYRTLGQAVGLRLRISSGAPLARRCSPASCSQPGSWWPFTRPSRLWRPHG